jgi:hypothetical protein
VAETGIGQNFLLSLAIKCIYINALETATEVAEQLKLSSRIVITLMEDGREKDLFEALGRTSSDERTAEMRYALTAKGREWAVEALNQSLYVGPAPVRLPDYHDQIERQRLTSERVQPEALERCFQGLVLPPGFVTEIGPAVNSGRSILLYGAPGNGKTVIAEAIGRVFSETIYVPYTLEVDGHVINILDSTVHREVEARKAGSGDGEPRRSQGVPELDRRWVACYRPLVITGGELTLEMLDLSFNPYSKVYEAPLQLKATGGVFVIDDFGRQIVPPEKVLNRWIIPLEGGRDYLTLHTGKKFPVPFDELVIFSTNLAQDELMDGAMRRRIHYKLEIGAPSVEEYKDILRAECARRKIEQPDYLIPFLFDEYYGDGEQPLSRYHPKWIIDQVLRACDYQGLPPHLDKEHVKAALKNI